mmetsp:Transcript_1164/g.3042  ORF Transcript_1164/g.3042 Transcript_1164/m.3042 type:complete len:259 (-) Transcript_1164:547-1323(-)
MIRHSHVHQLQEPETASTIGGQAKKGSSGRMSLASTIGSISSSSRYAGIFHCSSLPSSGSLRYPASCMICTAALKTLMLTQLLTHSTSTDPSHKHEVDMSSVSRSDEKLLVLAPSQSLCGSEGESIWGNAFVDGSVLVSSPSPVRTVAGSWRRGTVPLPRRVYVWPIDGTRRSRAPRSCCRNGDANRSHSETSLPHAKATATSLAHTFPSRLLVWMHIGMACALSCPCRLCRLASPSTGNSSTTRWSSLPKSPLVPRK